MRSARLRPQIGEVKLRNPMCQVPALEAPRFPDGNFEAHDIVAREAVPSVCSANFEMTHRAKRCVECEARGGTQAHAKR